jgi:hypothetical protein
VFPRKSVRASTSSSELPESGGLPSLKTGLKLNDTDRTLPQIWRRRVGPARQPSQTLRLVGN